MRVKALIGLLVLLVTAASCHMDMSSESMEASGQVEASLAARSSLHSGVMMQGFYWDVPAGGTWYNTMRNAAPGLANMAGGYGIDVMWFPPSSKAQGGGFSMGYDPYDYYDLGQYNQKGTTETRFGSQGELRSAISTFASYGIASMADIVLNHRSGGDSEPNPVAGGSTWTDFTTTASGMAQWNWDSFHPNYHHVADPGVFGGFPDISYSSGEAYTDMQDWMNWLRNPSNAGFSQWRFDYVKGVYPWVVRDMKSATGNAFSIGEYWDANTNTLDWWTQEADASAFDFALYYTLAGICNNGSGGGHLPDVLDHSKSFAARVPWRAVTFVGNHDTDEIHRDKMMAYAFILTYQGYPMIWWRDYFDYGLADGGGQWGNGIDQLVWVRGQLASGGPSIELLKTDDGNLLIYGAAGTSSTSPGYIVVINDHPTNWGSSWVQTGNGYLHGRTLKCYAWDSSVHNTQPGNRTVQSNGWVELSAPPRGYAVYSVDGL